MIERVGPDERLVVFRFWPSRSITLRGPGRALLVPVIDRPVRIDLRPQELVSEAIPATTADGMGIAVDVEFRWTVADPSRWANDVIAPFPVGLRFLTGGRLRAAVSAMAYADALERGTIEAAVAPGIEDTLISAGAKDVRVRILRVRSEMISEEQELARLEQLGLPKVAVDAMRRNLGR